MKNMNTITTQPIEQNRDMLIAGVKPEARVSVEVQGEEAHSLFEMLRDIKEYAFGPASIEEIEQRWMSADRGAVRSTKR